MKDSANSVPLRLRWTGGIQALNDAIPSEDNVLTEAMTSVRFYRMTKGYRL